MLLDLRPSKTSELVPFQSCSQQALDSCEFSNTHSSLSEDGSLTWLYKGSVLEVVSTATGHRVGWLDAQQLLQDEEGTVACVCELQSSSSLSTTATSPAQHQGHSGGVCSFRGGGLPCLVVGLRGSGENSVVAVLDVGTGLVVKAVSIPQQVTAVETVLSYGGPHVPCWAFSEQLRQFFGIVAVGTEGGHIYLVDLALDVTSIVVGEGGGPRLIPSPLRLLDPRDRDVETARQQALASRQHLALQLGVDEQTHSDDCFHFRGPDLVAKQSFNEDEVYVSCLQYVPQLGALAIGYSFGGFHLWKLLNPVIEFSSSVMGEDLLPVAFFVYQEPENDPKNFAYLWVCRDDRLSEQKQESICSVALYQMSFARRTFYANYGNFFEELNVMVLRMEQDLTIEPYANQRSINANATTWSSQLLSASIVSDRDPHHPHHHHHPNRSHHKHPGGLTVGDSFDDGCQSPDLSLCMFCWEAQDSKPGSRSQVFLAVFDMNRWYHAQMPSRIKCVNVGGQEVCPFMAVYRMTDAVSVEGDYSLVNMQMKPGSLLRFVSHSPMPPEQHFYPSSLAFDTVCVMSRGIVTASILGVQRQVLFSLEQSGPLCLLKPYDLYHRCVQTGLMARVSDPSSTLSVEEQQRSSVMTLALEQGLIRFINACIRSWADGDYIQQGCTLQFILSWAWSRVTAIKQQIDHICEPLFDWSDAPVDRRLLQGLQSCLCCLGHIRTVLTTLLTQTSSPASSQGQLELEHRLRVVTLLHGHLKVILWFVHSGLLPEHGDTGKCPSPVHYVYPASELAQVFADRRRQMMQLPGGDERHELILIDALVHSAGNSLTQLWRDEDGTGMYPPPSLHAAVSMYLLEGVEDRTKNAVMLYLLFDLAAVAHGQQEEFALKIPRFARSFDLPMGLVQQIHGFWLIDHTNFQEGLNQLCLRAGQELGGWQHRCVLGALMHQGESSAALRYLTTRDPPALTPADLSMRLSILIANRLVNQAVLFVRNRCGPGDQDMMLRHIFTQCQQQKLMNVLLRLPLLDKEEKCLQSFLSDNADSTAAELLVLHLLQRAQYVPAIRLNDRMKHRATMDLSSKVRERSKTRNQIVDGFRQALPAAQQYLISNPNIYHTRIPTTRKIEVPRPRPLSTVVTQKSQGRAHCQSAMILAVIDKVAEAGKLLAEEDGEDMEEEEEEEEDQRMEEEERMRGASSASRRLSTLMGGKKDTPAVDREPVVVNKTGPFLCTPSTPRHLARHSMRGQVVFPEVKEMTSTLALLSSSAALAASSPSQSTQRQSQLFFADCMTLLTTPKVDHTPARVASPLKRSTATTPHSILKVSRLPQSSPRARGANSSKGESRGMPPKRLGFSLTTPAAASSSSPTFAEPSTPTTLSPSSTPSPSSASAAEPKFPSITTGSGASASVEQKMTEVATPKHLRFAEPEVREISPAYVSPDNLHRPPLRLTPDDEEDMTLSKVQEAFRRASGSAGPGEDTVSDEEITFNVSQRQQADEEITFNMSRGYTAELMDTDNEGDSSTLPVPTPSPPRTTTTITTLSTPTLPTLPMPPPQHQQGVEQGAQQSFLEQRESASDDTSSTEEKNSESALTRSSLRRDRSPIRSVSSSVVKRETQRSVRTSTRSETLRSQSPPRGSAAEGSVSRSSVVETTMVVTQTKLTSSGGQVDHLSEKNNQVDSTYKESAAVAASSGEAMEAVEPGKEASALVEATRQQTTSTSSTSATDKTVMVEGEQQRPEQSDDIVVEVVTDDEDEYDVDMEIRVPTPIRMPSPRVIRASPQRTSRFFSRREVNILQRATVGGRKSEEEEEEESCQPTPPKLRRVSPPPPPQPSDDTRGGEPAASSSEWTETLPPLTLEMSDNDDDEKSNSNNSEQPPKLSSANHEEDEDSSSKSLSSQAGFSPARKSRSKTRRDSSSLSPVRAKSPPSSPQLRSSTSESETTSRRSTTRRSVDRSPPISPSGRSKKSLDRSPPVSPLRRSTRSGSAEPHSPPPSSSRRASSTRSSRSVDRSPPVSPSGRWTQRRSVEHSPPVSPSRRSTRSSVDRSPPVSPSRRSTRSSVDRSPPVSPSRRSTRSSVDRSPPVSPSRRSTRSSVDRSPPVSPSRRSTRSSVDRSPPVSPSRRSTRSMDLSPPPSPSQASSTKEPLTVETEEGASGTNSEKKMPPPPSPPRRSTRLRTPERSPGRMARTPERTTSTSTTTKTVTQAEQEREAASSSSSPEVEKAADSSEEKHGKKSSRKTSDADLTTPKSPSRRRGGSGKTPSADVVGKVDKESEQTVRGDAEKQKQPASRKDDLDTPKSPSRRSTRARTPEMNRLQDSSALSAASPPRSPSRRSSRGRTPDITKPLHADDDQDTASAPVDTDEKEEQPYTTKKSPSRQTRRRSKTPDPITVSEPPIKKSPSRKRSTTPEPATVAEPISPGRQTMRRSQTPEPATVPDPEPTISTLSSPGRRTRRRSQTPEPATISEPISPSRRKSKAAERKSTSASSVSLSSPSKSKKKGEELEEVKKGTSPASTTTETAVADETQKSRRRSRSKTPERLLSPARASTRLLRGGESSIMEEEEEVAAAGDRELKDIAKATELLRSQRRQQKEETTSPTRASAGTASPLSMETGDAPSFQFAPPTNLSRMKSDAEFVAPSEVSAFIFSPPITRATRSQRRSSVSSTSSSMSTRPRNSRKREESASSNMDISAAVVDTVVDEVVDQLASEEEQAVIEKSSGKATKKKKTGGVAKRSKRSRTTKASQFVALPSDSPIDLVPLPSESDEEPAPPAPKHSKPKAAAVRSRIGLRKRQAKLW